MQQISCTDCRDVSKEVNTPVAWVKEMQINFSDKSDRETQVNSCTTPQ